MTKIEWTDATINPLVGCSRISEGCKNCYAADITRRNLHWSHGMAKEWNGTIIFDEKQLDKIPSSKISKSKPKRIFVCSMSDIGHKNVTQEHFDLIMDCLFSRNWHNYQLLSKRVDVLGERIISYCKKRNIEINAKNLAHIWLGTSVESQKVEKRIDDLINVKLPVIRFLSCEPLLGNIDLNLNRSRGNFIDWIILGGESGSKARACNTDWIDNIFNQINQFNLSFPDSFIATFVKQLGSNPNGIKGKDRNDNIDLFPLKLQVREYPTRNG